VALTGTSTKGDELHSRLGNELRATAEAEDLVCDLSSFPMALSVIPGDVERLLLRGDSLCYRLSFKTLSIIHYRDSHSGSIFSRSGSPSCDQLECVPGGDCRV